MSVDMFIKLDKIEGESKDSKHKNEIDVLSWSWGASQSGSFHVGCGGGAGKVNIQDISITKWVDAASAELFKVCSKGTHIPKALLTVRKAGDKPLEYLKIMMEKVLVTSISTGGSGGEDRLTENVTLNFAKVNFTYSSQKDDGSTDKVCTYKWDIEKNEEA
jgi:type VI secretion system secreted protein Hcp